MMVENEIHTLERLKTHLQEHITQIISVFHGHIIKLVGDGILAEFPSVVEPVSAAVLIHQEMSRRNAGLHESERTVLRIGINLVDVIAEADDIFGDGVNIAARLEAIADPGSPQTLWSLSYVYKTQKRFEEAIEVLEKAIAFAPNYADGYGLLVLINNNLGRAGKVIPLIEKGIELYPLYTFDYPYNLGRAYYVPWVIMKRR